MKNPEKEYLHIIVWPSVQEVSKLQISSAAILNLPIWLPYFWFHTKIKFIFWIIGIKIPEKKYLHIIVWLAVQELSKIQISSGGHIEFANMADLS